MTKSNSNIKMTIQLDGLTEPRVLALQAMFSHWSSLISCGFSRDVSFMVDGDGDFHPKINIETNEKVHPLTEELDELAHSDRDAFDYDQIAWKLENEDDAD